MRTGLDGQLEPFYIDAHLTVYSQSTQAPHSNTLFLAHPAKVCHDALRERINSVTEPTQNIAPLSGHLEIRHAEALAKKAKSVRMSSGAGSAKGGLKRVYCGV